MALEGLTAVCMHACACACAQGREANTENKRTSGRERRHISNGGQSLILRKSQARMRNCILGQRSEMKRHEGGGVWMCGGGWGGWLAAEGESERQSEGWGVKGCPRIRLHNGTICYSDKREQEMRSRIWFPKGRAVNAANTCPPYSYTSECSAVQTR